MSNLKAIENKLELDDRALLSNTTDSLKHFISKFTFSISTIPQFIILIIAFIFQLKVIYIIILIFIYNVGLYFVILKNFDQIIYFAQQTKQLVLPYFQKVTNK